MEEKIQYIDKPNRAGSLWFNVVTNKRLVPAKGNNKREARRNALAWIKSNPVK